MKLNKIGVKTSIDSPTLWFLFGLTCVMLALWFPFVPNWQTFIHMWRVETASSVLLLGTLVYFSIRNHNSESVLRFDTDEWKLIILPLLGFVLWSGLSIAWAPSWKSAARHTFIWAEYIAFYVVFRRMLDRGSSVGILLAVMTLTLLLYAVPAIVEYCALMTFAGPTTIGMRYAKYGEQVVTLLPLVLLWVIRTRGKQFAIGAGVVTTIWLLVFCSFGRANYLLFGAAVAILFCAVAISKRYRRYVPRFAVIIILFAIAPIPLRMFSLLSSTEAPSISRFSEATDVASSNNFRKLMNALAFEMISEHPVTGIGADNFGTEVNKYRQAYGSSHPDDGNLSNAEDQIPEHAHNEFFQIAAELGAVGAALMIWLLIGIGVLGFRSLRELRRGSLYPLAAVLGMGMFLASSLVSSYSFRVMQNGLIFFFVLAVATSALFGTRETEPEQRTIALSPKYLRFACAAGILVCLGLLGYSMTRLASVIITSRANQIASTEAAMPLYEAAMQLDDENPDARQNLGMRLFRRQRYGESIRYLESAIRIGRAPSAELSYLASAQSLSGDPAGAEATMKMASEMYPRSPFVLTRYSTLLDSNGKQAEAAALFQRARDINEQEANTWRVMIANGPKALSELAARDRSYLQVMQLTPQNSIYAVVTERYIKFPDEQKFSGFNALVNEP